MNPALHVNFFTNGSIAVTSDSGAPVGTSSGAPTVIPAGYYTIMLVGPGGCANVPYFELHGSGVSVVDNMDGGELSLNSYNVYFRPTAPTRGTTTTRRPPVTFTFATSSDIQGSAPAVAAAPTETSGNHGTQTSTNPFAPVPTPVRGKLTGVVSASGKLTLAFKGKTVTSLSAGTYTITITDQSKKSGFMLEKTPHTTLNVTTATFVGKHTATIKLTAGKWFVSPRIGTQTYSILVK